MTTRLTNLTNEQIDARESHLRESLPIDDWDDVEDLCAQAKLALASPAEGMPARPDLEALTCTATREPEFGNRLKAVLEITNYADALRTAYAAIYADRERLKGEFKKWLHDHENCSATLDSICRFGDDGAPDILWRDIIAGYDRCKAAESALSDLRAERERLKQTNGEVALEFCKQMDAQISRANGLESSLADLRALIDAALTK